MGSVASSWFFLRKVHVETEVLSTHAVRLHFDYITPVNGSFTRLSERPLLEWHPFATIPQPKSSGKGYSLIVSNAGDWTRRRIDTLFNRVVLIATGSGIGPVFGHIAQPSCPTQLIWSTRDPESTFGEDIVRTIRRNIPDAVIHDTKVVYGLQTRGVPAYGAIWDS